MENSPMPLANEMMYGIARPCRVINIQVIAGRHFAIAMNRDKRRILAQGIGKVRGKERSDTDHAIHAPIAALKDTGLILVPVLNRKHSRILTMLRSGFENPVENFEEVQVEF